MQNIFKAFLAAVALTFGLTAFGGQAEAGAKKSSSSGKTVVLRDSKGAKTSKTRHGYKANRGWRSKRGVSTRNDDPGFNVMRRGRLFTIFRP